MGQYANSSPYGVAFIATPASGVSVSLALFYNVNAISANGTTTLNGGIDIGDDAYSLSTLGSSFTWSGTSFTFGPANARDAVSGANVTLPSGKYKELYVLATAVNGAQTNQPFKIYYSDGTTSTVEQSLNDWLATSATTLYAGEQIALTVPYRLLWNGIEDKRKFNLYGFWIPLNSAKQVVSIQLPKNRDVVVLSMAHG